VTIMSALQQWQRCPDFIDIDDEKRSIRLLKRDDCYAIRGKLSQQLSSDVKMRLPGDDISILRGAPPGDALPAFEFLPVYAVAGNTPPTVVTERIFLRLEEVTPIESVRSDIETLGFNIDDVPAHARHCAWLEPKSGRVDDALSKLGRLRALPGAAHVEPQLLRPRSWKNRL
jgi:hypothetical protein